MSACHNGSVTEGPYDKRKTSTKSWRWGLTGHYGKQCHH